MEDNVEEIEKKFETKKKSKKGIVICIVILLILLIVGGLFAFYKITSNPKTILKGLVKKLKYEDANTKIESLKADYEISLKINTSDKQAQLAFNELSKCTLKTSVQTDINKRKEILDLGLLYDNQEVIDSKMVITNESVYAFLNGIYDKYIRIDLDNQTKEAVNTLFDASAENDNKNTEEAIKIIKDCLIEEIEKSETITQDKATLYINDKEKKVKKSSIKLSAKDLTNMLSNIFTKLSESKIYEGKKEEQNSLKEVANEIKNTETDSNNYMIMSIYTSGLKNNFEGIKFSIYVEESNLTLNFELLKKDKNTYTYTISGDGQGSFVTMATGEIKSNIEIDNKQEQKGDFSISIKIPEIVTQSASIDVEVAAKYDVKINTGIDEVDTKNSILYTSLTDKDYEQMLEKLKQRPLIGPAISAMTETVNPTEEFDFDNNDDLFNLDDPAVMNQNGLVYNNYNF